MNQEKFENDNESSGSPIAAILSRYLPYWPLFLVLMILSVRIKRQIIDQG